MCLDIIPHPSQAPIYINCRSPKDAANVHCARINARSKLATEARRVREGERKGGGGEGGRDSEGSLQNAPRSAAAVQNLLRLTWVQTSSRLFSAAEHVESERTREQARGGELVQ